MKGIIVVLASAVTVCVKTELVLVVKLPSPA